MTIARRFDVVTPHQAAVAQAYLAERARERHHLVVYLSGAHAYGFPSPDSDLDLKCVHVAPTGDLIGLTVREGGAEQMTVIDGVEVDYGSNELGGVLRGVLTGNGNYLERLLGALVLDADDALLTAARPLVQAALSRRVARHYGGFARAQLAAAEATPTAKKVLYVLRTACTGRHLLETGAVETDLTALAPGYGLDVGELIARKRTGERVALAGAELAAWRAALAAAIAAVDEAAARSPLPVEPSAAATADLDAWLREVRRRAWDA
ncbi:MAG: nucleotidyltransferase domain-containing protein [Myxococcales bacterium]|nr:nucleotidyltransferase domain-containing protein [Myxococcales bacterium]